VAGLKISKAVIPAAGLGTRFLPATKSMPKEMLPIIDKPAIHYVVEEAASAGIEDILIITGKGKRAIEDYFDTSPELENHLRAKNNLALLDDIKKISNLADIHYIRQKEPLGLGDAVLKAEKHVRDEAFAVMLGDDIIVSKTPAIKQLTDFYKIIKNPIVGVEEVSPDETKKYGIVEAENDLVKKMVEKPSKTKSNHAIVGRYILTSEIFGYIKKTEPGYGGEIQLTDALNLFSASNKLYIKSINGIRYDLGNKSGYIKAIIDFAMKRNDLRKDLTKHLENTL
jgi:UTP--glucose-1-phosphate uridylyltransferase